MKLRIILGLLLLMAACQEPTMVESTQAESRDLESCHSLEETRTTAARKISVSANRENNIN